MRPHRMLFGVLLAWAAALLHSSAVAAATTAADPTAIVFISPEQIRDIGASVSLNCTVANPERYTVMWQRRDRDNANIVTALSFGSSMTLRDDRLRLNVSDGGRVHALQISDIQPLDSATYECQLLVSTTTKVAKHVELLVRTPAQVDLGAASAVQRPVAVGARAELQCRAHGYPRPTVHWHRSENALMPGGGSKYLGSTLTLAAVRPQDRGTYFCVADNGVGVPDRRSVELLVQFVPLVRTPRPRAAQALGYDIELECVVEAYPAPVIEWFRRHGAATEETGPANETLLRPDAAAEMGYEIRTSGVGGEQTVSVLRVVGVQSKHYGYYACRATNAAGQATAVLNLYKSILAVSPWKATSRE